VKGRLAEKGCAVSCIVMAVLMSLGAEAADGSKEHGLAVRFADHVEAKGETLERLKRAYGRLCSPPLDDLDFVLSDVHFKYTRRFTNYSGDISGRMLGALNACEAVLGTKVPMIDRLLAGFKKHQKPDGHFGADQNLDAEINQHRDMALLWGNGRLLLAMAERLARRPNAELRAMAIRLGDYMISTRKYYGKRENFEGVGGVRASGFTTCYPSLIDGLAALGEVTGEKRFVDEARFIARLSLLDRGFAKHHSHGRLTAYRGMFDIDRIDGTAEFYRSVLKGRTKIIDGFMAPTGGVTEYFDLSYNRDEGCSEGDWLRVNLFSWRATGNAVDLDVAENVLRSHIHATQFSNGGFGHWVFRTLADGKTKYHYGGIANMGSDSYWCCSMHCTQVLADVVRWGVVAEKDKVMVTWLAEVRATLKPNERSAPITVTTARTGAGSWTVTVAASAPVETTLALRVPYSADAITVDGKRLRGEGGWAKVRRTWSGKAALSVELPNEIVLERRCKSTGQGDAPVCVVAAPDLYCLPDVSLADGLVSDQVVPAIVMAARRPVDGRIPVVVEAGGKRQRATLVPMSSRPGGGARWLFRVRRVDAEAFKRLADAASPEPKRGRPVELEFGCDGDFEMFLNGRRVSRHRGWGECPEVTAYTRRTSNVLAIKAHSKAKRPGLIGMIRAGGRRHVTRLDGWSVVRVPDKLPAEWLVDLDKGPAEGAKVIDQGAFGVPPWNHVAAEIMNSTARWIWAQDSRDDKQGGWLFRYRFDLPRTGATGATGDDPRVAALAREVRDKGWIVYGARSPKGDWDLFLMRPDGSDVRNITNTPDYNEAAPRYNADNTKLLYRRLDRDAKISHDMWGFQGQLVIADADGSNPVVLGKAGEFPWASWPPDGRRISCLTKKGIQIVELASKKVVRTMPRKGIYQQLGWSPDGKWFCGVSNHLGENWTVARVDVETGQISAISSFRNCTPDWFRDAKRVIFSNRPKDQEGYGYTQLWMAGLDGKHKGLVYGEDGRHIYGGGTSPDDRYVLFTSGPKDGSGADKAGAPIGLMRLADAPTIGGQSKALRKIHPDTKDGPVLWLHVGWEPYWTYADVGGRK